MKKINWFNLKAGKEIRVQTLIQAGFNLEADFFSLSSSKTGILCECMKADGYKYDSPWGVLACALTGIACSAFILK